MSVSVRDAYIADGFADDCDELIHRLTTGEKLTYAAFAHVWKDMQMAGIYHNRTSGAEIAELSEEVIHIAKRYMVADTRPCAVPCGVTGEGHGVPLSKYLEGNSNINNLGVRPKGVFYRQGKEMDLIRELKNLSVQYSKVKEEISGPDVKDPNLNYYDVHFPTKLETSFKKLITGTLDSDDDDDDDDDEGEARPGCSSGLVKDVDSIRSIKDRAMKAKVNPMKHLVGVADSPRTRSNKSSTTNTPQSKPKTRRGVNYIDLAAPTARTRNAKKRKRAQYLDGSDDSMEEERDFSIDNEAYCEASTSQLPDLNLDSFTKPQSSTEKIQEVEVQNIELDSLPGVIRNETDGNTYEIEIIDNMGVNHGASTSQTIPVLEDKLKRAEKRDLKKTILKSRFKRMGMLPVANFPPE
ncbi:uncharacterized protein LOC113493896 [Trichoplusia ni]|uniref:Uncharacterized protein LOC113493896 n=1 Tax=Trichoplusia ni TaxID=7111 RepID=A0A7E5VHJ9_TRINI|nr:uncharacterized protein LOC113493896 [Trichoplusia ni]